MKRFLCVMLLVLFVAGCGKAKDDHTFQGVEAETDFIVKGIQLLSERDFTKAIRNFDMAIKAEPTNVENYLTIGQIYLRLKNYEQARNLFEIATKLAPMKGQTYFFLAISEELNGNREKAVEVAQKSAVIYMKQRDQEGFRRAATLIQDLTVEAEQGEAVKLEGPLSGF
ncbi:tetratricopeptide repeat protein [Candidatus Omnitrophota bacterium]